MSASTRTVQRTLGASQLGGMLVLLAVLAAVVVALAFGTIGTKSSDVKPAAGFAAPVVRDGGSREQIVVKGTNPEPIPGYWRPDENGTWIFVPFDTPDQALPSSAAHPTPARRGGQTDMSGGLVFQPTPVGDAGSDNLNPGRLHAR